MNIDCRVIGDLLPLYADESCSDASRVLYRLSYRGKFP